MFLRTGSLHLTLSFCANGLWSLSGSLDVTYLLLHKGLWVRIARKTSWFAFCKIWLDAVGHPCIWHTMCWDYWALGIGIMDIGTQGQSCVHLSLSCPFFLNLFLPSPMFLPCLPLYSSRASPCPHPQRSRHVAGGPQTWAQAPWYDGRLQTQRRAPARVLREDSKRLLIIIMSVAGSQSRKKTPHPLGSRCC